MVEHSIIGPNLGQLKGHASSMSGDPCADLDQSCLEARQGRIDISLVRSDQSHVGRHLHCRRMRHAEGGPRCAPFLCKTSPSSWLRLAFLDVLHRSSSLIVAADDPVQLRRPEQEPALRRMMYECRLHAVCAVLTRRQTRLCKARFSNWAFYVMPYSPTVPDEIQCRRPTAMQ